jgi:hypothetical protein
MTTTNKGPLPKEHYVLARTYLDQVDALLDYEDDDQMQETADKVRDLMEMRDLTYEALEDLSDEVSAYLDGNDDSDLEEVHDKVNGVLNGTTSEPSPAV